jgi:hypothetical protein
MTTAQNLAHRRQAASRAIDRAASLILSAYGWALILAASAGVLVLWFALAHPNGYHKAFLSDLAAGAASKPFQYRVLVPALARALAPLMPDDITGGLGMPARIALNDAGATPGLAWAAVALMYAALIAFYAVLRRLAAAQGFNDRQAAAIAAGGMIGVFLLGVNGWVYDLPQVFLFTAGLLLLSKRRWGLYLAVYAVALLNKETSFLLLIVYLAAFWEERSGRMIAAQLALFAVIRGATMLAFAGNPGPSMEKHLADHIAAVMISPTSLAVTVTMMAGIAGLVALDWRRKPLFLRRAVVIFPVLLLAYWVGGYPYEIRVFFEAYPIILLLGVHHAER